MSKRKRRAHPPRTGRGQATGCTRLKFTPVHETADTLSRIDTAATASSSGPGGLSSIATAADRRDNNSSFSPCCTRPRLRRVGAAAAHYLVGYHSSIRDLSESASLRKPRLARLWSGVHRRDSLCGSSIPSSARHGLGRPAGSSGVAAP